MFPRVHAELYRRQRLDIPDASVRGSGPLARRGLFLSPSGCTHACRGDELVATRPVTCYVIDRTDFIAMRSMANELEAVKRSLGMSPSQHLGSLAEAVVTVRSFLRRARDGAAEGASGTALMLAAQELLAAMEGTGDDE